MLTPEQEAWLDLNKCRRLTFSMSRPIEEELFLTKYGAHTIPDAMALELCYASYWASGKHNQKPVRTEIYMSHEMFVRNERCIQEHGCACYGSD